MAGTHVTVCLPPIALVDLVPALKVVMAPFETYRGFPPERDIWESWKISGGSAGLGFWIRPGHENDPRLLHDQPSYAGAERPSRPGMCTGGPRGLLDLAKPYLEATADAERAWDLWHEAARHFPPAKSLEHLLAETGSYDGAQRLYLEQPVIQEFQRIGADTKIWYRLGGLQPDGVPELARDRSDFVRREVALNARSTDLLTLDGWWITHQGRATHSTFGTAESTPDPVGWERPDGAFDIIGYLMTLPEGTTVVTLRCHT
jgi:hypothetical protein